MKKYLSLLLVLLLTLSLAACQNDDKNPEDPSGAAVPTPPATTPASPSEPVKTESLPDPSIPEEELREMIQNFGAEETASGKLQAQKVSLFYQEKWSADSSTTGQFLLWYLGYVEREDLTNEEKTEKYKHPKGENIPFFPQDVVEPVLQKYFDVDVEKLRKDACYNAELKGYSVGGGWFQDVCPLLTVERYEEKGDLLSIYLRAAYEDGKKADRLLCLTVQLLDEGYHYLSHQWVIERSFVEKIVLSMGAEAWAEGGFVATEKGQLSRESEYGFHEEDAFVVNGWTRLGDQLRIALRPQTGGPDSFTRFLTVQLKEGFNYDFLSLSNTPVNEALIEDIVLNFGASYALREDGSRLLQPQNISLYYSNGWSLSDARAMDFFSWYWGYRSRDELSFAEEQLLYSNPKGKDLPNFYPQDIYEHGILQYFNVSKELLRSDKSIYDEKLGGYSLSGVGGIGESPSITIGKEEQSDSELRIPVTLNYADHSETRYLTVLLDSNGTYRYLSYLPENDKSIKLKELKPEGNYNAMVLNEYHEEDLVLYLCNRNAEHNAIHFLDSIFYRQDGSFQKSLDVSIFLDDFANDEAHLYYIDNNRQELIQLYRRGEAETVLCPVNVGDQPTQVYLCGSYILWLDEEGLQAYDLENSQQVTIFDLGKRAESLGISQGWVSCVSGQELWIANLQGGPGTIQKLTLEGKSPSRAVTNGRYVIYRVSDALGLRLRCLDLKTKAVHTFGRDVEDSCYPQLLGENRALYWNEDGRLIIYDLEEGHISYQNPELNISALLANDAGDKVAVISQEAPDRLFILTAE